MLKIVIAFEHSLLRYGIKSILHEKWQIAEIAEAHNAAETSALLHRGPWDLLILDSALSGLSCLQVMEEVHLSASRLPVLVVSLHPDNLFLQRVFKSGASGYLAKHSTLEEFVLAVRILLERGRYVSASLAEQTVFSLQTLTKEQADTLLSNREFEVIRLLASGKTVSQIARMLSLSVKTISTYRARILKKMGLQTTAELIRYAVQNGLVQ